MKKTVLYIITCLVALGSLVGCHGKFVLSTDLAKWNASIENKWLRSGALWVIIYIPIRTLAFLGDFIIFNTIEFWSGSNPIASGEKDLEYVKGEDTYRIHAQKAGEILSYTVRHYHGTKLVDTTLINWNVVSGKSVVSIPESGRMRDYVVSRDAGKIRIDQYANGKILNVTWYTPPVGTAAGYFAAVR